MLAIGEPTCWFFSFRVLIGVDCFFPFGCLFNKEARASSPPSHLSKTWRRGHCEKGFRINLIIIFSSHLLTWVITTDQAPWHAAGILHRDLPSITETVALQIRRDLFITSARSCVFLSKGVCHEKPFAVDRMACNGKTFSLQTDRARIGSCGLVRNLKLVSDRRFYEKRLRTTPFLQGQHVMIVKIAIHNRKSSG